MRQTMAGQDNNRTNRRQVMVLVSAWVVGLGIWASGMVGLAFFF
jgi:NO-binding membrane sensor protein with MHYT domain